MKRFILFFALIGLLSCSSDDNSNTNGFMFDSINYKSRYAWIYSENNTNSNRTLFSFSNKYINETSTAVRNIVSFDIDAANVTTGTFDIVGYKIANEVVYDASNQIAFGNDFN